MIKEKKDHVVETWQEMEVKRDSEMERVRKRGEKRLKKTGKMTPMCSERITNRRRIDEGIDEIQIRG